MANLIQQANDLEYVPKDQLIQMSQNPDNNYPSYLVLAEIQRRTQNEKAYAAQQPQPETTVSEELVQEFAGQQGLQGAMAQSPGPQNAFPPSDMSNMAPPSPQMGMPSQQMMGGGLTEYAEGGRTGYQVGGFTPTAENPYPTAYNNSIPVSGGLSGTELVSETFTESPQTKFGAAGQKIFEFGSDVANWAAENPADAALAGLTLVPGIGLAGSLGLKAISAISKASKGKNLLKSAFIKPGSPGYTSITAEGVKKVVPKVGSGADRLGKIRTQITSLGLLGGKQAFDYGMSPAEEQPEPLTEEERIKKTVEEEMAKFRKNQNSDNINTSDSNIETKTKENNADMLIGLGGAILRSNTIGELGGNIADMSTARQARQDSQKLAGLRGRLMEAQIGKYEADVSNMPVKQLEFALKQLDAQIKEGAFGSEDERTEALRQYNQLLNSYLAKTGFSSLDSKNQRDKNLGLEGLITEVG